MSAYDFRYEKDEDGVAVLTLDRPQTLNSLTFEIYGQLERLFVEMQTDPEVKAVVLTGEAGRSAAAATLTRSSGFCSRRMSRRPWRSRG